MKSQIQILLEEGTSNKAKGNCFEHLVRNLLAIHHYEIRGNINFSGMEIDLMAVHKHTEDKLYVECKAKEKVTSDELSKFAFNVLFKKVDRGYFFRTQELESQAGALLSEMRERSEFKNLNFFEPAQIIDMLSDAKMVMEPTLELAKYVISKRILAVTYFGDYFIYLINQSNALPTNFIVTNAKDNGKVVDENHVRLLKSRIAEIGNLDPLEEYSNSQPKGKIQNDNPIEAISEVQESENWYDYLPASSSKKHFVGRDEIRTKILSFLKQIRDGESDKRIFYLNGKSGWGKSSLVLELKGRCGNVHYKNKFFAIAIDTRSAISDNFVALSFKKLIDRAIEKQFILKDHGSVSISFTSTTDLLSSDSIQNILNALSNANKYLVLIFDQFEDVFRKKDFFKTFYKFLTDVTDKKPNLIIGFSWKSDFFIQSDDPSYHIWQQAKEQAREFSINEFGEKEIDGVIKQLEGSVNDLDKGIKDRIKESSQGLPWLTKKLCIHIYDQIIKGLIPKENLVEANLNILDLFKKDEERLQSNELKAIKLIAKRAYDGSFFDETEVGDIISSSTITSLLHQRLIIRSGANYNIYWDIYRDYLVTGNIPTIGESYLLRQGPNLCLEVFLLFESGVQSSVDELVSKHPKGIGQETLYNILIELRNLGVIQKHNEKYSVTKDLSINKDGFVDFMTTKFQNYTPYLYLKKSKLQKIAKSEVISTLKTIFKQEFQDKTWDVYANYLVSWFLFCELDIKARLIEPIKGRGGVQTKNIIENAERLLPRTTLKEIQEIIPLLVSAQVPIAAKYYRDLTLFGLLDVDKGLTDFGRLIAESEASKAKALLLEKVASLPKMKALIDLRENNPKLTAKDAIVQLGPDFFEGAMESSKLIYAGKALSWLK